MNILQGNVYKYKELCVLMNEQQRTGKSKQLQINNWKRYFEWENPTTQKYLVTKVFDEPKEKITKGGRREGSGAKRKLEDEFNCIINYFIRTERNKDEHFCSNKERNSVFFSNDSIYRFFGFYKDIYSAKENECIDSKILEDIYDKIRTKAKSFLFDKINRDSNYSLEYTVFGFRRNESLGECRDDLLESWIEHQREFMEEKSFRLEKDILKADEWHSMNNYISSFYKEAGYIKVKRCRKLSYKTYDNSYTKQQYIECKKTYNRKIITDLLEFFHNKIYSDDIMTDEEKDNLYEQYKYVVRNYVLIA